jgi:hypothetical protein
VAKKGPDLSEKAAQFDRLLHGVATRMISASFLEIGPEIDKALKLTSEFWDIDYIVFFEALENARCQL